MTITEEGKALRVEVSKLRPDKRRRYGDDLSRRIVVWVDRAMASGMTEPACGLALGIKTWRFRTWRTALTTVESAALALVPIETSAYTSSRPIVVTPAGYRVEGLAISEIVALLRELA
jgi:hypothetical protein